jgi:hypothetical protein
VTPHILQADYRENMKLLFGQNYIYKKVIDGDNDAKNWPTLVFERAKGVLTSDARVKDAFR